MPYTWILTRFPELSNPKLLDRGGQKIVFSADHLIDGKVVIKFILGRDDILRAPREKIAVERINSNRIPRIFETGTTTSPMGPCVWIREQRIEGEQLRRILQRGPLDFITLLNLGINLLEAVTDAEATSVVHRDIKPENIIMDLNGEFRLIDFGLARLLDLQSMTSSGNPFGVGTLGYCPPEQLRNRKKEIDSRSDLFSIGVVLFECSTGYNPFIEGTRGPLEVVDRTETQPMQPLALAEDTNGEFGRLVSALTQKFSDQRPSSAVEAFDWIKEIRTYHGL